MEIITPLNLSPEEESLVDMHSVLNVLNVVVLEIVEIGDLLDASNETDPLILKVRSAADALSDQRKAHKIVSEIDGYVAEIEAALDHLETERRGEATEQFKKHRDNLKNVFQVIRIRATEIQARVESNNQWVQHSIPELKKCFEQFLQAVERNSHGGYRIVQNLADKEDNDYLINFELTSEQGDTLLMPIIFHDVMRDVLANARKYTVPGGRVSGGLHMGQNKLRFVVEDSGIGIPEDEIANVVKFGYRGSNVQDRPTRGGGFGLTKAYATTRKHNGRMWIESSPQGTRIEIQIPLPQK